jgi:hypothetical protein
MNAARSALVACGLSLLLACGSDVSGPCTPGRVCPVTCKEAGDCQGSETCSKGYCAQPQALSNAYAACALDADCSRGDHCSLGACAHDCLIDEECVSGTVCSSRGLCVPPAEIGQPPPVESPSASEDSPVTPTALGVSAASLDFGRQETSKQIQITNSQGAPITYRALSSKPWLSADPSHGTVGGAAQALTVTVDRSLAGADTHASLTINSTGGSARVEVVIGRDLSGLYTGQVRVTEPFEIATSRLQVNLFQSEDGTALTGYVDAERSLLFPVRAGITGTISGDEVTLTFVVAGAKGSLVNPHYPVPIRRTIKLSGKMVASEVIEGTASDSVAGPLESPIALAGAFRLQRAGEAVPGEADPVPRLPAAVITAPEGSDYADCAQCPPGGDCSSVTRRGDSWLKFGVSFYRVFNKAATGTNPFGAVSVSCKDQVCLNQKAIRCAQFSYVGELGGSDAGNAAVGLLDSLEVLADYGVLFGNQKMVEATEEWKKADANLAHEVSVIQTAGPLFTAGSHSDNTLPQAMLDPYFLRLVAGSRVSTDALKTPYSHIPVLLGDDAQAHAKNEYLRRQALAIGGALRAALEAAQRQHRLGDLAAVRATAFKEALQAYLDLAMLTPLLTKAGLTPATFPDLAPILRDFEQLSRRFDLVNEGRNPAGYFDGFVPILARASGSGTNFEQIWDASMEFYNNVAKPQMTEAKAEARGFENDLEALKDQVNLQREELGKEITALCGETDLSRPTVDLSTCGGMTPTQLFDADGSSGCSIQDAAEGTAVGVTCGVNGSEVARAASEFRAAVIRVKEAKQRIANLTEEIKIEEQRARTVSGIHDAQANLILANGEKIRAIDQQIRILDAATSFFGGFLNLVGGVVSKDPGMAIDGLSSVASGAMTLAKGELEDRKNLILTTQGAQVEFNVAKEQLADSAAAIQTRMLESANLAYDQQIALEGAGQALDALVGLLRRARLLEAQYNRRELDTTLDLRRLLQYRLYADHLALSAQVSFDTFMSWAFLATRAFEYELNMSYATKGELWKARSAADVNAYMGYLKSAYVLTPLMPQLNWDAISVRDDLLDMGETVKDKVTGHDYTPRERFCRYVNDPANRDADGNLRIVFSTHRPDKEVFSRAVCNDRIREMHVNLVGDSLGAGVARAYVRLAQDGISYLRSCGGERELVAYDLSGDQMGNGSSPTASQVTSGYGAKRVARIEAGINVPVGSYGTLPANTDLAWRGIIAGPWELLIDQRAEMEPENAKLDLTGIDDIEIHFLHEASTLQ